MRMWREFGQQPCYEARLDPYLVRIRHRGGLWIATLWFAKRYYYLVRGGGSKTKAEAIEKTVREWLRMRIGDIISRLNSDGAWTAEGTALLRDAGFSSEMEDATSIAAFRDWLEDKGYTIFTDWIIQPGRKAGIVWPDAWKIAVDTTPDVRRRRTRA